ncbi:MULTISPECIES: hypothetical protein [unclassified Streptomyces]|uniref:hypothetical protein n=1 Tax=unclassified Streptomyces TaxID=2593676 RepID=UPI0028869BA1|nr:hypothetical protein [Streptomyces sp. DSM 41633]
MTSATFYLKPDGTGTVSRAEIALAAADLPLDAIGPKKSLQYWAQVGGGMYEAQSLIRAATGLDPANVQEAVKALRALGFATFQRVRFNKGNEVVALDRKTRYEDTSL